MIEEELRPQKNWTGLYGDEGIFGSAVKAITSTLMSRGDICREGLPYEFRAFEIYLKMPKKLLS